MTSQDFEPLSPQELRQLVESNARSIQAVAEEVRETNRSIDRLAQASNTDIMRLANLMEQFFTYQAGTNQSHTEGLEEHEQRISSLEGGQS